MSSRDYEEAYIKYDAETDAVRLTYEDGCSLCLNKDDIFEAFVNGEWEHTWLFNSGGWGVVSEKGNVSLMDGTKVKIRIPK